MPFEIGDQVVHPVYGIGYVTRIEEKQISDEEKRLYYKVEAPKRSLWIPVETQKTMGLREVTAGRDLDRYRALLKSPPISLIKNHHRRHRDLISRLKQGSFQIICEIVRDLTAWGWRKPLGPTDQATLRKTRESLCQEWAIAAGVSKAEADKEVESLLECSQPFHRGTN